MAMDDIIFEVVKCLVVVLCMVITRYAVPWLKQMTANNQNEVLAFLVDTAVQYAEQCYVSGKEKKAIVTEYLQIQLAANGIKISDEQLNALIESAVYTLKQNQEKKIEVSTADNEQAEE